jgi:hypothetical protein
MTQSRHGEPHHERMSAPFRCGNLSRHDAQSRASEEAEAAYGEESHGMV